MPPSRPTLSQTVEISSTNPPPPLPPGPLWPTIEVLDITDLNANAGHPSRLANLNYSNSVTNTNLCAQNAVANQQAHAQLAITITGRTVNKVGTLGATEARASVAALTDNALADEIASLRAVVQAFAGGSAPGPWPINSWKRLLRLLEEIARILKVNARLQGTGTYEDPYQMLGPGPLYVRDPITLAFRNVPADQIRFTATEDGVSVNV